MSAIVPDSVLVVGSGSIAQRHARNMLALGVGEVIVITARDVTDVTDFADPRVRVSAEFPDPCPRYAVVANDTDKHVRTARDLVAVGAHVLVEKPIAAGLSPELEALAAEVAAAGRIVRVAYNLRFLGVMGVIRDALARQLLGQLLFARIQVGQYLPDWRPNRDISAGYSASVGRGGGVALDLSHEVDYMRMLFGQPREWYVRSSATGVLGIEAPDVFDGIYAYGSGFSCTVHMDYLERQARRQIRIVGADGILECDIIGGTIAIGTDAPITAEDSPAIFDTQTTYVAELESFFAECAGEAIAGARLPTLEDAADVLRLLVPAGAQGR